MQRKGPSIFFVASFASTTLGLVLLTACGLWAGDPVAPASHSAAPATRAVLTDQDEADVAKRMAEVGDPRIIPVAMQWLATEQDGQPIGYASPRLRAAMYVAEVMRVREAIPLLMTAYDARSASGDAKSRLAGAIIGIDPTNLAFCREVLAEDRTIRRLHDNPGAAAAAGALADQGDEDAAAILLRGYAEYLTAIQAGERVNIAFHVELNRLANMKLREQLLVLRKNYTTDPASNRLAIDAEVIRMNAQPQEKRLAIALDAAAKETERFLALTSLGQTGGAEVLPSLEKAEPWSPDFKPTTKPAKDAAKRASASGQVNKKPHTPSGTTLWAIEQLRRRNRLGHSPENPPALRGVLASAPLGDGERVMRFTSLVAGSEGHLTTRPVGLAETHGQAPDMYLSASEPLIQHIRQLPTDSIVRVKIDPKTKMLLAITPMLTRPGEATPGGYVLVKKRTVRDGDVERLAVVLSKLAQQVVARVPNRNKPGGGVGPDTSLARALESLSPGDVVEARLEQLPAAAGGFTMLSEITPYRPMLPAQFVRWVDGPQGAAVEVTVGREKRTYLMPEPREAVPVVVAPESRNSFWPGCAVRIRLQDGPQQTPPRLHDFDVEGFIDLNADGSHVTVHAASATLQGDPRKTPFLGMVATFGMPRISTRAEVGVRKFLAGNGELPGNINAETREKLAAAVKDQGQVRDNRVDQLNRIFDRHTQSTDKTVRRTIEQEMYLGLQRFSFDLYAKQQRMHDDLVALLTPEQYKAAVALGHFTEPQKRPATRPTIRSRPTTRPAAAP
jgi:hypothetical protein